MKESSKLGYVLGLIVGVFALMLLAIPERDDWHSLGAANPGHEDLECTDCHTETEAGIRQQLQTNVRAFLGMREGSITFGHQDVDNDDCLACHERATDHHPVYRFLEPRFVDARREIAPQLCESCHLEHQGQRVTVGSTTYCVNCHTDLDIRDDPIDVPHVELVVTENWESCLTCHDFHGNHIMEVPTKLGEPLVTQEEIKAYFLNSPSPYSDEKMFAAKETLDE